MPRYKVLAPGFMHNTTYSPTGRDVVITDRPLDPVPTWLKAMEEETHAERKRRLDREAKQAKRAREKASKDAKEIESATLTEDLLKNSAGVETL